MWSSSYALFSRHDPRQLAQALESQKGRGATAEKWRTDGGMGRGQTRQGGAGTVNEADLPPISGSVSDDELGTILALKRAGL